MERNLDFDAIVNRRNTDCLKYDFAVRRGKPSDILPFWVADMDFKTSSYVEDALVERAKEAIFGYSDMGTDYFEAVGGWIKRHHGWETEEKWLIKTPGVVFALAMAVKAYTDLGDAVLIQQPVYYPFKEVIEDNGRVVISSDLVYENGHYHMDLQDFEEKIVKNKIKLFILCNPHNPVGRVWTKEELTEVGNICLRHGVIVVSDEIHNDFVFKGKHQVFAGINKEFENISITCTSPSKTFNLASMLISNIFIPNEELRRKFQKQVDAAGISQLSILGLVATKTAYEKGEEWYLAMMDYIKGNIEFAKDFVEKRLPGIEMVEHEGTYLIWLDFNKTGYCSHEVDEKIVKEAGLWLDSGNIFGKTGAGFQRINVACPRSVLEEGLKRIEKVFKISY